MFVCVLAYMYHRRRKVLNIGGGGGARFRICGVGGGGQTFCLL